MSKILTQDNQPAGQLFIRPAAVLGPNNELTVVDENTGLPIAVEGATGAQWAFKCDLENNRARLVLVIENPPARRL
jgi:hypothetical protein